MVWGVARYEFRMAIRRWGVWLAFALAGATFVINAPGFLHKLAVESGVWAAAGQSAFMLNLWMPLVAGIALADRLPRDRQLATLELLRSTSIPRWRLVIGKYLGGLMAVSLPVAAVAATVAALGVASGESVGLLAASAVAFLCVNLPPLAFVAAFSIACPAILPVRVYQVLFTGYWFWGNFLNPKVLPTVSGTILVASGLPQARAFFDAPLGRPVTTGFAALNLATLMACAAVALVTVVQYLRWQDARA